MRVEIGCIVEGHGEVQALPVLIRRIAREVDPALTVGIPPPVRVPRGRIVKPTELERAVELLARRLRPPAGLLLLLDSDEDCPATLGPELLRRVQAARGDLPAAVVLAKMEFEAWFLAAAASLAGKRGLAVDFATPPAPEAVGGAKAWLTRHMVGSHAYSETVDQPALAAIFDMEVARQGSPSFDKCYRDVARLLSGR